MNTKRQGEPVVAGDANNDDFAIAAPIYRHNPPGTCRTHQAVGVSAIRL